MCVPTDRVLLAKWGLASRLLASNTVAEFSKIRISLPACTLHSVANSRSGLADGAEQGPEYWTHDVGFG